jgi:SlyX protein
MDEKRLIEIETKLAHQEQLLFDLDRALTGQQAQLMKLETLYHSLLERIRALPDSAGTAASDHERPPHY